MRRMYHMCRLVHGDFSEYNMLYYKGEVWVIDVSQAVEHDHPMALDFLRRDCVNINDFFKKKGVQVLNTQKAFDFITDITITNENEYLTQLFSQVGEAVTVEQEIEDNVFKHVYIPRSLQELSMEDLEKEK
jgi:RIO kinase 1